MSKDFPNKKEREQKEAKNLFADAKFCRNAWRSVGNAILQNPATKPFAMTDKEGFETSGSQNVRYTYDQLSNDIKNVLKENREPTELEMILACQINRARYDTSAATFVRDTLGAKPIDESKVDATVTNPFEYLTDEELDIIAEHRAKEQASKAD